MALKVRNPPAYWEQDWNCDRFKMSTEVKFLLDLTSVVTEIDKDSEKSELVNLVFFFSFFL